MKHKCLGIRGDKLLLLLDLKFLTVVFMYSYAKVFVKWFISNTGMGSPGCHLFYYSIIRTIGVLIKIIGMFL